MNGLVKHGMGVLAAVSEGDVVRFLHPYPYVRIVSGRARHGREQKSFMYINDFYSRPRRVRPDTVLAPTPITLGVRLGWYCRIRLGLDSRRTEFYDSNKGLSLFARSRAGYFCTCGK